MPSLDCGRSREAMRARRIAQLVYEAKLEAMGIMRGSTKWLYLTCRWAMKPR